MSPIVAIFVAGALLLLHLWWRRRFAKSERELVVQKKLTQQLESERYAITAQKRAEQEALFNSMVEGVLLLAPDGRIQLANCALEKMFDLRTDIRGKTILEAFRLHELNEFLTRLEKKETVIAAEIDLPGLEKRCFQVNATAVLDSDKTRQGTILVFHDLTRLKELENTRQEFVANVSHELRTPLSLIKGYAETLIHGAKDNPEVALRFLQTIDKHADRLTYLIDDLLTISRLESGQIQLKLQTTSPRAVAARVIEDLSLRATGKEVRLQNQIPELTANADPQRIQQVLFNLIDNAIKYGKTGGTVVVDGHLNDKGMIEISVQDDGPGIPEDAAQRIFERFYRVDKGRAREQGGTGLGLSIVKHIIHCHGGTVWLKSLPGEGTTFFFTLPAQPSIGLADVSVTRT